MIACVNERPQKSLQKFSSDKVIFKNVHKAYKVNQKFAVEYILTPKTETSSKDYVGIYHRDWTDLTEVVAFENAITPPSEEPSLYRCIEFDCRSHLCKVIPNQDYQFVYVSQYCNVLGRSNYFQFKSDKEEESSWNDSPGSNHDTVAKGNLQNVGSINLTPEEIAYNQCFFRDELIDPLNMPVETCVLSELATKSVDSPASSQFGPRDTLIQSCDSNSPLIPKRGRPLVKTRESGFFDVRNISPPPPPSSQHGHNSFLNKNFFINFSSGQNLHHMQGIPCPQPYYGESVSQATNKHWNLSGPWIDQNRRGRWKCEHDSSSRKNAPPVVLPLKTDGKRGAVPKKCPKCRAPSDFSHQQQLMQHELDQARDEIRDLKAEIEHLKHSMELAKAGQAKLRVSAEMARKEGRYAMTFLNNLMFSLINQYRTKIVNFDNTVMYVTREIQSPGWLVPRNNISTLICGRPSIVKMVSGRDKELKAIIGQQELKIRDLHSRLIVANKIIDRANLLNLEFCDTEVRQILDSPQMTPRLDDPPRNLSTLDENLCNSSSFDLADLGQVLNNMDDQQSPNQSNDGFKEKPVLTRITTVADVHRSAEVKMDTMSFDSNSVVNQSTVWRSERVVSSNYYPSVAASDPHLIWHDGREESMCGPSGKQPGDSNETNNNTINTDCSEDLAETSKCGVCSPGPALSPEIVK